MGIDWKTDLEEYIRQAEPGKADRSAAWQTAIGLQAVDGLKPSGYLLDTAKAHIEGDISLKEASGRIISYYRQRSERAAVEDGTKEADIVATRIAELLSSRSFHFSPAELQNVHRHLFANVFDHAGCYRSYNITKKEWVLNGDTVTYAHCDSIGRTLEYDFSVEKNFSYQGLSPAEFTRRIAAFTAGIWQIHPFSEGNTRTTAVFIVLYLRSLGFEVDNGIFARHSWYFRNALVRANFNDFQKGIHSTRIFLEHFFENLLFGGKRELRNRFLHVDYGKGGTDADGKTAIIDETRHTFGGITSEDGGIGAYAKIERTGIEMCGVAGLKVLSAIRMDPHISTLKIAEVCGMSRRNVERAIRDLKKDGYLHREGSPRHGSWHIDRLPHGFHEDTCGFAGHGGIDS